MYRYRLSLLVCLCFGFAACNSNELTRERAAELIRQRFPSRNNWQVSDATFKKGFDAGLWNRECRVQGPAPKPEEPDNQVGFEEKHDWAALKPGSEVNQCAFRTDPPRIECRGKTVENVPPGAMADIQLFLSGWSPSGSMMLIKWCEPSLCTLGLLSTTDRNRRLDPSCKIMPREWVSWSPDEQYAVTLCHEEGFDRLDLHRLKDGRSQPVDMGPLATDYAIELWSVGIERSSLRWAPDSGSLSFDVDTYVTAKKYPRDRELTEAEWEDFEVEKEKSWQAGGSRLRMDVLWEEGGKNPVVVCRSLTPNGGRETGLGAVEVSPDAVRAQIARRRAGTAFWDSYFAALTGAEGGSTAAAVLTFDSPVGIEVEPTGITDDATVNGVKQVEFTWKLEGLGEGLKPLALEAVGGASANGRAWLRLYDDGWRVIRVDGVGYLPQGDNAFALRNCKKINPLIGPSCALSFD